MKLFRVILRFLFREGYGKLGTRALLWIFLSEKKFWGFIVIPLVLIMTTVLLYVFW